MLRLDRWLLVAAVVVLQGLADVYLGLRIHALYRTQSALEILQAEFDEYQKIDATRHEANRQWIQSLDAALYSPIPGEPPKTTPMRKPTAVEIWQLNRDKELRERIHQLETWRLTVQRRFQEHRP